MAKVLVVDDDVDIAEVVEIILINKGFEVYKVYDGARVVECVSQFSPDVILLDVNIAEMDGREICKQLKSSDSPHNHIPVVLFSARHDLQQTYLECEASDFISKPFNSDDLIRKLEKLSGNRNN